MIALSGNTGFSATPHLHFFVDQLEDGQSVTFPVLYKSGEDEPFDIVRGGKYLAPGGKAPADEGPLAGVHGTGELSSIRPKLIEIVKAAKTPEQAAVDLKKHLLSNRAAYKKIYKETFAKSQKGDKSAMKELQDYLNGMDLQSQPEIARLLDRSRRRKHRQRSDARMVGAFRDVGQISNLSRQVGKRPPTPARRRRLAISRATLLASSGKRPWPSGVNTHFGAEYLHLRCGRRFAIALASRNSLPPYVQSSVPARWLAFCRVGLSN